MLPEQRLTSISFSGGMKLLKGRVHCFFSNRCSYPEKKMHQLADLHGHIVQDTVTYSPTLHDGTQGEYIQSCYDSGLENGSMLRSIKLYSEL